MAITRYRLTAERIINSLNVQGDFLIHPGDPSYQMIHEIARQIEIAAIETEFNTFYGADPGVVDPGDLWYDSSTEKLKRHNLAGGWDVIANNFEDLADFSGTLAATSITYAATNVDAELTSHDGRITTAQSAADDAQTTADTNTGDIIALDERVDTLEAAAGTTKWDQAADSTEGFTYADTAWHQSGVITVDLADVPVGAPIRITADFSLKSKIGVGADTDLFRVECSIRRAAIAMHIREIFSNYQLTGDNLTFANGHLEFIDINHGGGSVSYNVAFRRFNDSGPYVNFYIDDLAITASEI